MVRSQDRTTRSGAAYGTFGGQRPATSPASQRTSKSAPTSLRASPKPRAAGTTAVLPAQRWRAYLFLCGVAVFLPAAVAALLCSLGTLVFLASATTVVDKSLEFHRPTTVPAYAGCAIAATLCVLLGFWLRFTAHMLWAFALSQTRRQKSMSIAGEGLRWAFNRRAGLTAIVFSLLIYEIVKGIVQEFEEYTSTAAAEWPLWNLFEGGGSEVLVLFQTLGAALEVAAYRDAEADAPRSTAAAARIGWRAADLRHAPWIAWLALEAGWDVIMVREYFDEDDEDRRGQLNPNRVRARMCAIAGVVKTIGDMIDCYFDGQ